MRFYGHFLFGRPFGGAIVLFCVFTGILFSVRPPVAPSFVARRKIGEKGVPRRRKLHILRFAFRGKSSVVPLLLLSPPNPLRWALAGAPVPKPPFGFWLFIRGFGGETCLPDYVFARVQLTRFRPVRGVLRTVSTDSCLLHVVRRKRWH